MAKIIPITVRREPELVDLRAVALIPLMAQHLAGEPVDLRGAVTPECRASLLTAYALDDVEAFILDAVAEARLIRARAA
jgi:hypothetical protein